MDIRIFSEQEIKIMAEFVNMGYRQGYKDCYEADETEKFEGSIQSEIVDEAIKKNTKRWERLMRNRLNEAREKSISNRPTFWWC